VLYVVVERIAKSEKKFEARLAEEDVAVEGAH
jgi:hypothetical protein